MNQFAVTQSDTVMGNDIIDNDNDDDDDNDNDDPPQPAHTPIL